jgi:hypothetical protein
MCDISLPPDDELNSALRELDSSKAIMLQKQAELTEVIPALSHVGCSANDLQTFEVKARELNEATSRYLLAVGAFNAACRKGLDQSAPEAPLTKTSTPSSRK